MTLIPGVPTVHPRSTWEDPKLPVYDPPVYIPPRQDWSKITTGVAHYTAADDLIDGDPGEHAEDLPGYIRAIQRDYRTHKGYSIGYLWAVDWLGGAWELRGWDYRAAANLGRLGEPPRTANYWTCPVLYLVDGNDRATPEALATGRAIYREAGRRAGRTLLGPVPHSHLDPTPCPGVGVSAQITAGLLSPAIDPVPPVIINPPPSEEDDMSTAVIIRFNGLANSWLVGAGAPVHLTPELLAHWRAAKVPEIVQPQHAQLLKSLLHQCGLSSTGGESGTGDLVRI